jgi:hypothetical protein
VTDNEFIAKLEQRGIKQTICRVENGSYIQVNRFCYRFDEQGESRGGWINNCAADRRFEWEKWAALLCERDCDDHYHNWRQRRLKKKQLAGPCVFWHSTNRLNKMISPPKLILQTPCDLFFIACASDTGFSLTKNSYCEALELDYFDCEFRGIPLDSLNTVLQRGIDVMPTNEVISVGALEKALEYGGWPKVILALRRNSLKRTFKEIPADSSREEIEAVRREFPTIVKLDDRSLWCTRLQEDNRRIGTDYEVYYAVWIPGDPWAALKAIFLLSRPEDHAALIEFVHRDKSSA